jgi:eukaryotic-like serine/threonine-protein kinase
MSLKNFILSKVFLKNLGLAVSITIGSILVLLIFMNIYTRHGQARAIPDFFGLTIEESSMLAKKSKLRFQVIDSIYTTAVPRGCVAEQNPKPGFKVKKWRKVALTINAFNPEMMPAPDLVGLPQRQALLVIESSGLKAGQLKFIPDLSTNFVIKQLHNGREVKAGEPIQKGSIIDLVVGRGLSNERTPVPDLIGMQLEKAKNYILAASLNLGAFIFDTTVVKNNEDSLKAFVYKQNPAFREDAKLQMGESVYIWLSLDSARLPSDSTLVILPDSSRVSEIIENLPE